MDELVTQIKEKSEFQTLLEELKSWNKHTNLTAIREDSDIIIKHFADSLSILEAIPSQAKTLLDVGSGAGFPGLPISIARPDLIITLLESVQKKASFLEHMKAKLSNPNISVINERAEEAAHKPEMRENFDVVVARAVAELRVLAEYCLPFVKVGGVFIAQKSSNEEEIADSKNSLDILGGKIMKRIKVNTPGLANRELVVIEKTSPTPDEYPRRTGIPSKRPL